MRVRDKELHDLLEDLADLAGMVSVSDTIDSGDCVAVAIDCEADVADVQVVEELEDLVAGLL